MAGPGPRSSKRARFQRILWPTDFSPTAKAALPYALGAAGDHGAQLVLLHVIPVASMYVPEVSGPVWMDLQKKARAAAVQDLRRLAEQMKDQGVRTHTVVAEGVPFDQILRVAKKLRCDLIVLATHGRTGLKHVLMGSVAENVVRRAPCPVLTVRPPRLKG
jgi:nucleotide-binding universal stress UspA family protein